MVSGLDTGFYEIPKFPKLKQNSLNVISDKEDCNQLNQDLASQNLLKNTNFTIPNNVDLKRTKKNEGLDFPHQVKTAVNTHETNILMKIK